MNGSCWNNKTKRKFNPICPKKSKTTTNSSFEWFCLFEIKQMTYSFLHRMFSFPSSSRTLRDFFCNHFWNQIEILFIFEGLYTSYGFIFLLTPDRECTVINVDCTENILPSWNSKYRQCRSRDMYQVLEIIKRKHPKRLFNVVCRSRRLFIRNEHKFMHSLDQF